MIKNGDKKYIRHYLLFCFQKKVVLMHRIIYETYNEDVVRIIRTYADWFK